MLFSTETGDAWLLDPADRLAARLARDEMTEPIRIEETDTTFAIVYIVSRDRPSCMRTTIAGG